MRVFFSAVAALANCLEAGFSWPFLTSALTPLRIFSLAWVLALQIGSTAATYSARVVSAASAREAADRTPSAAIATRTKLLEFLIPRSLRSSQVGFPAALPE